MTNFYEFCIGIEDSNPYIPLIKICEFLDKFECKDKIALCFSRAIVPNTENVLMEYKNQYQIEIIKKQKAEKSDYIVLFDNIKSNTELVKLMNQHGLEMFYINSKEFSNMEKFNRFFESKNFDEILLLMLPFKLVLYFDQDRTANFIFNLKYFELSQIKKEIHNWVDSLNPLYFQIYKI